MKVFCEYMGEDREVKGSKIYKVEAINVTTTRNRRKFTHKELAIAGRSLSFRPLNRNHEEALIFNKGGFLYNTTLDMHYNESKKLVEGRIRISESEVIRKIDNGEINAVSIEQMPTQGETCDVISCEQHGVAFIGMALLDSDVMPGDPNTKIHLESVQADFESIESITISNAQRECQDCTDHVACHKCSHKSEADKCMEECLSKKKDAGITINDQAIAICLSECGKSKDEQWKLYEKFKLTK